MHSSASHTRHRRRRHRSNSHTESRSVRPRSTSHRRHRSTRNYDEGEGISHDLIETDTLIQSPVAPLSAVEPIEPETVVEPESVAEPFESVSVVNSVEPIEPVEPVSLPQKTSIDLAREHIQSIRDSFHLNEPNSAWAATAERLLNEFSEGVYPSPVHCFLELVQNADDNEYRLKESINPTLTVTYRNRRLRTDCNELGFSKEDVDSICSAGLSTKKSKSKSTGEKGLGFKSVFGVADVVWIVSKAYTFKFDSGQTAGKLVPVWESLPTPEEALKTHTSMVFQLSSNVNVATLLDGIREYSSKILLFLNKLRCITLDIEGSSGQVLSITRNDRDLDRSSVYVITLTIGKDLERRFITIEYKIDQMPADSKRPNQTNSEIKLAFPIDANDQPILESQDVYSFLPVRDYGFMFLLQANFILPTSRHEVKDKNEWNKKIKSEIPNAFVTAIEYLVQDRFRYSWFKFLPTLQEHKDFFEEVRSNIWSAVKEKPLLVSENGELENSSSLQYIPPEFRHSDGVPFTLCSDTKGRYLSRLYSRHDWTTLKELGVKELSLKEFMTDLKLVISEEGIENKPPDWHLSLAAALKGHKDLGENINLLRTLEIIPLRKGWISADKGMLLFPPKEKSVAIPPGIKVFEIHETVRDDVENQNRRALFQSAGAKPYSLSDIHHAIVFNQSDKESVKSSSLSDLRAQLDFLCLTDWPNEHNKDIWVMTMDNECSLASSVYVDSQLEDSAAAIFAKGGSTVPLLHSDYETTIMAQGEDLTDIVEKGTWIRFLFRRLGIWEIPRLVRDPNRYLFELSEVFERVTQILPSPEWLKLLKDHRHEYEAWINQDFRAHAMREKLGLKLVDCYVASVKPALRDTYLIPKSLLEDTSIPVRRLKVENEHDPRWSILSHFGVVMEENVQFYLLWLQHLHELGNVTLSKDQMYKIYRGLQERYKENKMTVKEAFQKSELIYVPIGESGRKSSWLSPNKCVWEGPDSLLQTPRLEKFYEDCKKLFQDVLEVKDADPERLLNEIETCRPTALPDILALFQNAEMMMKKNGQNKIKGVEKSWAIFPVYNLSSKPGQFHLTHWYDHSAWWIADNMELRESAGSKIPLLAFDYIDILRMPYIVDAFNLETRMLSTMAEKKYEHEGRQQLSLETAHFGHRIRLIRRLISDRTPQLKMILHGLKNIQLYQADKLTTVWTVVSPLTRGRITSNPLTVQSFVIEKEDRIQVHVVASRISRGRFPIDLSDQLSSFCGIIGQRERKLAWAIFYDVDLQDIEETLAIYGFSSDKEWTLPEQSLVRKSQTSSVWKTEIVDRTIPQSVKKGSEVSNQNTSNENIQEISAEEGTSPLPLRIKGAESHVDSVTQKNRSTDLSQSPILTSASHATGETISSQQQNDVETPEILAQEELTAVEKTTPEYSIALGTDDPGKLEPGNNYSSMTDTSRNYSTRASQETEPLEPEHPSPPLHSIPSKLMNFIRSGSTGRGTVYQGGLDENAILSLYHKVVDIKQESHEPIIVGGLKEETAQGSNSSEDSKQRDPQKPRSQRQSKRSQDAPYILDPGLPHRSLRHFMRNMVNHITKKESATVIYLSNMSNSTDGAGNEFNFNKSIKTHPGRVHVDEKNKAITVFVTLPDPIQAEETYSGELFVAKFLEREFPNFYNPDVHWTSPLRSRARYSNYKSRDDSEATFTLRHAAIFTEFLVKYGYDQAKHWSNTSIIYHLEVQTTKGDCNASFQIRQKSFDIARAISKKKVVNDEVFVLIRVYNIYNKPNMAFFVNPWTLYASGKLDLSVQGDHYIAALANVASDIPRFNIQDHEWRDGYKYQRLEHGKNIRLLKLFPGNRENPLQGSLVLTSLDAGEKYIAVSYTWGPALKPYHVHTRDGDIPIPASLSSALIQVRKVDEAVLIWADAISISQTNNVEKVHQIGLLPAIFHQASQVFGWVGDKTNKRGLAMKTLRTVAQMKQVAISVLTKEEYRALSEFFQEPWFVRSWIIQEVILAKDLVVNCGSDDISWEDLYEAMKIYQEYAKKSLESLDIPIMRNINSILSLGETRRRYQQLGKRYELLGLFELFQHARSTFTRDRLFTLLNIALDATDSPKLAPDYSSPLEDIVCRYAAEFVQRNKTPKLLYRGRISSQPARFPSWIPNWTANPYPKTITTWHPECKFCATRTMEVEADISPEDSKVLLIKGSIVDEIKTLSGFTSEVDDALDYIAAIFQCVDSLDSPYPTGETTEELKWKIPVGNAKKAPWGDWLGKDFKASFQALATYMELSNGKTLNQPLEDYASAKAIKEKLSQLHEDLWLYLFTAVDFSERFHPAAVCLTKRGYVGLVPAAAQEGDLITVMYGAVVPFCLRRDEHRNMYQLQGEAYIHGIMHGEALDFEEVQTQTFKLF
ncbi:hypothetical protein B7463_g8347, partial [Scytalidium lignicola]